MTNIPERLRLGSPARIREAAKRCVHFNGVMSGTCEAGVDYGSFGARLPYRKELPCWDGAITRCPQAQFRTYAEQEVIEREIEAAALAFVASLAEGRCPVCGVIVEQQRQVGRCVYAEPCNHRLYQGKAQ